MEASAWPALLAGTILLALAAGCGLWWLEEQHWYFVILVPSFAAVLIGFALAAIVALTHCRQTLAAAAAGVCAGILMLAAHYYFGMVHDLPPGHAHRLDLLARYIVARLETDVEEKVGAPRPANAPPKQPSLFGNSLRLSIELICAMVLAASLPASRARRPYVADVAQWMSKEERRLPPGLYRDFRTALASGSLGAFVERVKADAAALSKAGQGKRYGSFVLEYLCHPDTSPLEYPIYVTFINDVANVFDMVFRSRNALRQVPLEHAEVADVRPLFPRLDHLLAGFQARAETPAAVAVAPGRAVPVPLAGREAVIREVDGGGTVQSGNFLLMINLLGLVPLITFFGGFALMVAGGWGLSRGWATATASLCICIGGLSFAEGAVQAIFYSGLLEVWYSRRRLMNTLVLRADPIVAVNSPDVEMVNLTLRENWAAVKLDVRDDIGLLELDDERRELRIEGDKRRYWVPLDAVVSCAPECFYHPLDKQMSTPYWYVRLVVPLAGRNQELLFSPTFRDWCPRTGANRQLLAADLCRRIRPV
jgi:hypothetical protein